MTTVVRPLPDVLLLLASDIRWRLIAALARSDRQVQELVSMVDQPANLVSYHLRKLRAGHLVAERRSSADARDVYYSLNVELLRDSYFAAGEALHPGLGAPETQRDVDWSTQSAQQQPTRILFLCTHNSARSQMGEAIMRMLGGESVEVFSAGSEPTDVHPDAIAVLAGQGIDISQARPEHLDSYCTQHFDYVITVCDRVRETCPVFPDDPERIHWSFPDPSLIEDPVHRRREFEQIAIQLTTRIRHLLTLIERDTRRGL